MDMGKTIWLHCHECGAFMGFEMAGEKKEPDRMPFGKYKDKLLSEVPLDYLQYIYKEFDLTERTYNTVSKELIRRGELK